MEDRLEEDMILRDFLISTQTCFTEQQMREIENDAAWIRLTDDGIQYSRGMVELLRHIYRGLDEYLE